MLTRYIRRGLLRAQQLKTSSGIKWNFSDDKKSPFPKDLEKPQGVIDKPKCPDDHRRELFKILEQGSKLKCPSCMNAWADFKKALTYNIEKGNLNKENKILPGGDLGKGQTSVTGKELGGLANLQGVHKDQQNLSDGQQSAVLSGGNKMPEHLNEAKTVLAIKEIANSSASNVPAEKKILLYGEVLDKFQEAIKEQKNLGEPSIVLTIKKVEESVEINASNKEQPQVSEDGLSGLQEAIKHQMILKQSKVNDGLEKPQAKTNEPAAVLIEKGMDNIKEPKPKVEKKRLLYGDILEQFQNDMKGKHCLDETNLCDDISLALPSGGVKMKAAIKEQKHFSQKSSNDGKKSSSPDEQQTEKKKTEEPHVAVIMKQLENTKTTQVNDEKKSFLSAEGLAKLNKGMEKKPDDEKKAVLLVKEQIDVKETNAKDTILQSAGGEAPNPSTPTVVKKAPEEILQGGIKEFNATDWKNALFPDDYISNQKPLSKQNIQLLKKIREEGSKLKCATCLATWVEFEKILNNHINEEYSRAAKGKDTVLEAPPLKQAEESEELSKDDDMDDSDSAQRRGPLSTLKSVLSNIFSWKK